jgi:hypothetical protein
VRAIHHHVAPGEVRDDTPTAVRWSGVSSYYFDREEDARDAVRDPDFLRVLSEHERAIPQVTHLLCNELLIYDNKVSDPLPLKMMAFFKRLPSLSREAALEHYRGPHAALADKMANNTMQKFVQNHVLADYTNPDQRYDYDGGPETWFRSRAEAEVIFADTEHMQRVAEDEERFIVRSELAIFWTDEVLVYERSKTEPPGHAAQLTGKESA